MRRRSADLYVACILCVLVAKAGAGVPTSRIAPARVAPAPRVDGVLDDAAWTEAAQIDLRPDRGKGQPTTVKLAYDASCLYLGWVCQEPEMDKLLTASCPSHDRGWGDDGVELFVQPRPPDGPVFQVIVNAANQVLDLRYADPAKKGDKKWDSAVRSAVTRGTAAWTIEMAVPWAELELTPACGPTMGLNLMRWYPRHNGIASTWGLPGSGKALEFMGALEGIPLDFAKYSVALESPRLRAGLFYGANEIPVVLHNTAGAPRTVKVEAWPGRPETGPAPWSKEVKLPANAQAQVTATITTAARGAQARGCVRVLDNRTGLVLCQMSRERKAPYQLLLVTPQRRYLYGGETTAFSVRALVGEASLKDYTVRMRLKSADGATRKRAFELDTRESTVPIDSDDLAQGENEVTLALHPKAGGAALDSMTTRVVRLRGPFE